MKPCTTDDLRTLLEWQDGPPPALGTQDEPEGLDDLFACEMKPARSAPTFIEIICRREVVRYAGSPGLPNITCHAPLTLPMDFPAVVELVAQRDAARQEVRDEWVRRQTIERDRDTARAERDAAIARAEAAESACAAIRIAALEVAAESERVKTLGYDPRWLVGKRIPALMATLAPDAGRAVHEELVGLRTLMASRIEEIQALHAKVAELEGRRYEGCTRCAGEGCYEGADEDGDPEKIGPCPDCAGSGALLREAGNTKESLDRIMDVPNLTQPQRCTHTRRSLRPDSHGNPATTCLDCGEDLSQPPPHAG